MNAIDDPWAEAAIEQNRRWLKAYVLSATGDPSACDDLVQDVFVIAYEKRATFQVGTNFGGWLRMIARRVILRHHERRARQPLFDHDAAIERLDSIAAEEEEQSASPYFLERRKQFIMDCLATITRRVRTLLILRYVEQKSSQFIAELLGMSVSAVDVAAFRAKIALAHCVEAKEKV